VSWGTNLEVMFLVGVVLWKWVKREDERKPRDKAGYLSKASLRRLHILHLFFRTSRRSRLLLPSIVAAIIILINFLNNNHVSAIA